MALQLLGSNEAPFDGKVYLIDGKRRRWVKDGSLLNALGATWPDDVQWVSAKELSKFSFGAPLPESLVKVKSRSLKRQKKTMQDMREFVVSSLDGSGVEFGAAANPLPVPVGIKVRYADLFETPLLEDELYDKQTEYEYVEADLISGFDDMKSIRANSVDFIIASHVIEHVRNPIKSFELAWHKLRKNGKLVLIVPKFERTLDSTRSLTTLDHVIEDYKDSNRYRDAMHVAEFHAYAKPLPIREVYAKMLNSITDEHHSMHYHVWNEKTFNELVSYIRKNQHPWKVLVDKPALAGKENYEFYLVLQKTV